MQDSYWTRLLDKRLSRRRTLAGSAGLGVIAAFLAACGGGEGGNGGTSSGTSSSLITEPEDRGKEAKAGGVYKWFSATEPNHLDGIAQGQSQLNVFNGMVYSSLVSNKMGYKQPSSFTEVVPNMAESWEFSPDRTQITFKLRQGVKWHNRNPVNGRAFDSSDVVATWQRYEELPANNKAANSNKANPNAPIVSVTAPDARTVVYKLKEPASYMMQRLSNMVTGEPGTIQPREAGQGFDPRLDQIGTGGFILEKWEPSVGLTYKRNPEYWDKEAAYIETLEVPIIPQYATQLAAFQTGQLYLMPVRATDLLSTKRQTPGLAMYQTLVSTAAVSTTIGFGWEPWGSYAKSPFLDMRVRQAVSMALDRDAYIDTFGNVSTLEAEGLPVETYWYSSMGPLPGVHLDPRDKNFGPNAVYYERNVAEAKKLLAAAGFPDGIELPTYFVSSGQFANHTQEVEILNGWANEVGFKTNADGIDYNTEYLKNFITQQGKHDGWLYRRGAVSSPDPVDFFVWRYWSKSGPTSGALGYDVNGRGDQSGDPEVDSLIEKALAEADAQKQVSILHDLQRYLGKMQYGVPNPGIASGFDLTWPVSGNFRVHQSDSRAGTTNLVNSFFYTTFVDETKPPLKPA